MPATAPTRCRSCGRETTTTEDGRCDYCGQPKMLADEEAERAAARPVTDDAPLSEPVADADADAAPYAEPAPERESRPAADLRPQYAAAALAAVIAIVGLLMGSALLLIAAAVVLVIAVAAAVIDDGW